MDQFYSFQRSVSQIQAFQVPSPNLQHQYGDRGQQFVQSNAQIVHVSQNVSWHYVIRYISLFVKSMFICVQK